MKIEQPINTSALELLQMGQVSISNLLQWDGKSKRQNPKMIIIGCIDSWMDKSVLGLNHQGEALCLSNIGGFLDTPTCEQIGILIQKMPDIELVIQVLHIDCAGIKPALAFEERNSPLEKRLKVNKVLAARDTIMRNNLEVGVEKREIPLLEEISRAQFPGLHSILETKNIKISRKPEKGSVLFIPVIWNVKTN
ncbi:MAG: hypothetical protein KAS30_05300, partial [Candidatus Diapherotrites archaeon]|nr:hypothetical protein [Candidatus Diapherotrites archaeon]